MGLVMQFICLVVVAYSLFSQGSAEEGISPSPSTLSSTRPIGVIPQPPVKSTPEPTNINGQGPSLPPSIPAILPPTIPAVLPPVSSDTPPPETIRLPPLPPLSLPIPVILPPITSDAPPPPPPLSPQSTPSVLPPLTSNAPPPPLTFPVPPPLSPPPTPVVLPPLTSNSPPPPPPFTSEVPPPLLPPTTPAVLPPLASNMPPPPLNFQVSPPPTPVVLPPLTSNSPPPPSTSEVPPPLLPPTTPAVLPPLASNTPPPPLNFQVPPPTPAKLPPLSSNAPPPPLAIEAPPPPLAIQTTPPLSPPPTPAVLPPPAFSTPPPPLIIQVPPPSLPPSSLPSNPPPQAKDPVLPPPDSEPIISPPLPENKAPPPVQSAPPPREPLQRPPPVQPEESPPSISPPRFAAPPRNQQPKLRKVPSPNLPDPEISPLSAPISSPTTPNTKSPPAPQESNNSPPPRQTPKSPPNRKIHPPESLPSNSFNRHQNATKNTTSPAQQGSVNSPAPLYPPKLNPNTKHRHHTPPPLSTDHSIFRSPSQSPESPPISNTVPFPFPKVSPPSSSIPKMPLLTPFHSLPPPPPNDDCTSKTCNEPLTNTPPGSPCGCVLPMQVELRLSVALYTFFPLVAELANEIAIGVFMRQSQVRIMGANAASQDPEKTIALVDLVPLGDKIDNTTAFLIFQRFWNKQVLINPTFFGDYEVLAVRYTGLPPSPPSAPSDANIIGSDPYNGNGNNGVKPLGVDVSNKNHRNKVNRGVIAIIILSASFSVILLCAIAWVFLYRNRHRVCQPDQIPPCRIPSFPKLSGNPASMIGSGPSSVSLSFESSIAPYTGSAKTYTSTDIERATDNFNDARIVGEGGFGRVYSGVLDDGTKVAVKVLKRDDQQGGREFLAEVEMLSRLHHRNLVKLIGICIEEHARCLVYELITNGSVDSHLHGIDRDKAPLDWVNRMKIALGAARALAYLHEDSSPRVIHRDFKSSNILLEDDFTPKVSDFGLARAAFDEENKHISTRVMGTFGYVAPEYAMTGHLLVKSDVYSYGVVLLELLTGRKPVDMSQPPGQENLVAWARPHLGTKEGLESIIDPSISGRLDFRADTIAKVAAIASMCVQPEVSHRPFMGEVVQALKLVCNEFDENDGDDDAAVGNDVDPRAGLTCSPASAYESPLDVEMGVEFRRHSSSSGNLIISRSLPLWQKLRKFSGDGSVSEHGVFHRLMRSGSQ